MFINKFNVVLSFKNLKNVGIVYIFFYINEICQFLFSQSNFLHFKYPPFLAYLPVLKNLPSSSFFESHSPTLTKGRGNYGAW